jgi:hypothetical protein
VIQRATSSIPRAGRLVLAACLLAIGLTTLTTATGLPGPSSTALAISNPFPWGQCTWYAWGRRPRPRHFGNGRRVELGIRSPRTPASPSD